MAAVYATLIIKDKKIRKGRKTLAEVPAKLRAEVEALLEAGNE